MLAAPHSIFCTDSTPVLRTPQKSLSGPGSFCVYPCEPYYNFMGGIGIDQQYYFWNRNWNQTTIIRIGIEIRIEAAGTFPHCTTQSVWSPETKWMAQSEKVISAIQTPEKMNYWWHYCDTWQTWSAGGPESWKSIDFQDAGPHTDPRLINWFSRCGTSHRPNLPSVVIMPPVVHFSGVWMALMTFSL